jgi:serine/threonine protein kinase
MNICDEIKYNEDDIIGKGSFAVVYKGINIKTNEIIAIKKITNYKSGNKYILNEINILTQLHNSENIINLINYYNIDNIIYLITNYCSISLDKYIKQHIYIQEENCQLYFSQIVNALKILYNLNIFHRDIKPSNILIESNRIYLCDFGLAKVIMSPEIFEHMKFDIKSDLWSLGLVLFEMLTGYNYLVSKNIKELVKKINTVDIPVIESIRVDCKNILLSLLDKNIETRISWEELFVHKWIINIVYENNENINNIHTKSFNSDISADDFLILSTDNEIDKIYSNNSFTFNDIFEKFM